jgi:hypothetical protein
MKADMWITNMSPEPQLVGDDDDRPTVIIPEKEFAEEVWLYFNSVDLLRALARRLDCLATEFENRRALAKIVKPQPTEAP